MSSVANKTRSENAAPVFKEVSPVNGDESLRESILLAIANACGLEPYAISDETMLEAIGFDSMALLYVVTQIGVERGQPIPLESALDLFAARTVGALCGEIQRVVMPAIDIR